MFCGQYKLAQILDEAGNSIDIPVREDGFTLTIESLSSASEYRLGLKIGNVLGGSFKVDENQISSFGPIMSTMMMPPPEIYQLERTLNSMLPESQVIQLSDGKLTFEGPKGVISFQNDTS